MTQGPWTLRAGDDVLGRLTLRDSEMWNVHCAFTATLAFDAWRERFLRKSALAGEMEAGSTGAQDAEFDALEDATSPPALTLRGDDGQDIDFGLLYIEGDRAGFRGL